jgi:hypothetical protein
MSLKKTSRRPSGSLPLLAYSKLMFFSTKMGVKNGGALVEDAEPSNLIRHQWQMNLKITYSKKAAFSVLEVIRLPVSPRSGVIPFEPFNLFLHTYIINQDLHSQL